MNTAVRLPLNTASPAVVRDLLKKYPNAEMHVVTKDAAEAPAVNEDRFWDIIAQLDWSKEGDDDAVIEPVVDTLSKLPVRQIYEFEDIFSEKLYLLDAVEYASNTGESAWKSGEYMSVDGFLYDRCCVVANGRELYEQVLKDPTQMPKDLSFEALLYVAHDAYKRKTGKEMEYIPAYNYETYSNKEGWKDTE